VRSGGEADNYQACVRVAKSGHGPSPVFPVAVGAPLDARDAFTIRNESRAFSAIHDFLLQYNEIAARQAASILNKKTITFLSRNYNAHRHFCFFLLASIKNSYARKNRISAIRESYYPASVAAGLRFFHICAVAAKLDASQFGSAAILDANQFESVVAFADRQNRIRKAGFCRLRNTEKLCRDQNGVQNEIKSRNTHCIYLTGSKRSHLREKIPVAAISATGGSYP
jgi:hypothetical protein